MKRTIILLSLLLSSCATYDKIFMAPFDPNEYALVNEVRTLSLLNKCDKDTINEIYISSFELKNYSEYLPANELTIKMTSDLFKIVSELKNKNNPDQFYCQAKLNIIESSSEEIQKVIGNRPR